MKPLRHSLRAANGASTAEVGPLLFLLFILFFFPLIDLATIGLRSTTIFSAAREAGRAAGRSKTYLADVGTDISATNMAKQQAVAVSKMGYSARINPSDVKVTIVATPINAGSIIRQTTPLAAVSPKDYIYQLEVEVTGSVDPLVTMDKRIFGDVPGLTKPLSFTARSSEFAEFPDGLTK